MLENHLYNLVEQLAHENKSLWRIKNNYQKDAGDCHDCAAFWKDLEQDKEKHVRDLMALIKKHSN